jgi:feruloyl esterase
MTLFRTAALSALLAGVPAAAAPAGCESLAKLALPHVTISVAETRTTGEFTPPGGKPFRGLPGLCRVGGSIAPSADSDIRFEVWMPASNWNGKFRGIGNGGFAGSINFAGLGDAVLHSYAAASTDTGHQAQGRDAQWALRHPEKIIDFGYRAIHETTVAAKAIVSRFYGEAPRRSYFSACSNGGRQALMEAQRFPADYDGIISGAPANYWTHLLAAAAWDMKATLAAPGGYISAAKLPAIQAAALAACDAADSVKDGVIENPAKCRFDPTVLLCKGSESDACLTAPQVAALKTIYAGLPKVLPGYSPGGEAEPGGWAGWITGPEREKAAMFDFGTQFYKNMVYENPEWDYRTFDAARDTKAGDDKMARILNSTNPDLSAFQKRGGKLILYHGWSDAAIPAQNAIDYYGTVTAKMGNATQFVRLYMVPGMQHCGGGSGPNVFGQGATGNGDPRRDVGAAMEAWVEKGIAPREIVAEKRGAGNKVERTRPLCPYPQVARWKGTGSTDAAANFVCAAPAR